MPLELSKLALKIRKRPGVKFPNGTTQAERNYVDFIIGGESISERAISAGYDLVSVFTREWMREEREKSLRRLLLTDPADFPNNRRSLLVCGECGDLGGGAVSIVVDLSGDRATWREFGYENSYEEEVHFEKLKELGPFRFDLREYENALAGAMALLQQSNES
jgi:hypothetical protein